VRRTRVGDCGAGLAYLKRLYLARWITNGFTEVGVDWEANKNLAICMTLFELPAMNSSKNEIKKSPAKRPNILLWLRGPGLVTGAADDDPSGIATYSQAGA
jgi:hypothetical protein